MQQEVSRAVTRVLPCEDAQNDWYTQNELSARFKEINYLQYSVEGCCRLSPYTLFKTEQGHEEGSCWSCKITTTRALVLLRREK